jgi:hypothetical protein
VWHSYYVTKGMLQSRFLLLSAVMPVECSNLITVPCQRSHLSLVIVRWLYVNKNKTVEKRESCASRCLEGIQESGNHTKVFQPSASR